MNNKFFYESFILRKNPSVFQDHMSTELALIIKGVTTTQV